MAPSPAWGPSQCQGKRLFPARNSPGTAPPCVFHAASTPPWPDPDHPAPLPTPALHHRWIQPPWALWGENTPGWDRATAKPPCPLSRHPGTEWWDAAGAGALPPGHVAAAESGSAALGELPGPSLPGAEKHEKAEIFPRPAAQTGKGEGKEGRGGGNVRPSPAPPRREGDVP